MDPKNFLEALVVGEQEQAADSFSTLMQNKLSDALEVKKVEVASGIFGESVEQIDEISNKTLKSYMNKAWKDSDKNRNSAKKLLQKNSGPFDLEKASTKLNKAVARRKNIDTAMSKLGKSMYPSAVNVKDIKVAGTNEEVEQVDEVLEPGSAANAAKQMTLHRTNLQKMQMDPLERSKIMSALKSRVSGKRLNMQQNVALTGYLERAGGLSNVPAAVRNKALKQQ